MTEADNAASSLAQHARLFDAGAHVVAAAFVDGAPTLALADGVVLIGDPQEQKRVVVYPDAAMLTAIGDGKTLLTGGDDGRVVAVRADGSVEEIADEKGRWIDALALRGKACAWSAGKQVRARDESGAIKSLERADDSSRPRFPAQGLSPCGNPLQWRDALVSES